LSVKALFGPDVATAARRIVFLGAPIMASRAGLLVMLTVDNAMTGQAGVDVLAAYGAASVPHLPLVALTVGMMAATLIMTAQARGAGRSKDCGGIWHMGMIAGLVMGSMAGSVLLLGPTLLSLIDTAEALRAPGGAAMILLAPGMPAIALYVATTQFLEGSGRAVPGMVVVLIGNLVNGLFNWLLIYGSAGFPEMGAEGATLATTIARWVMVVLITGWVLRSPLTRAMGSARIGLGPWRFMRRFLTLGLPISFATLSDAGTFFVMGALVSQLGSTPLAAYQIALSTLSIIYMASIGLQSATSVIVGEAFGKGDGPGVRRFGWTGFWLDMSAMVLGMALVIAFATPIARVYTSDPGLVLVASGALFIIGFVIVADGMQGVLLGILRGMGDVNVPMWLLGAGMWLVAVPLGLIFGRDVESGVGGVLWALGAGLFSVGVMLMGRFWRLSRRMAGPDTA